MGTVTAVCRIVINATEIHIGKLLAVTGEGTRQTFAKADGFQTAGDFDAWFLKDGPEFRGILILWEPDPRDVSET